VCANEKSASITSRCLAREICAVCPHTNVTTATGQRQHQCNHHSAPSISFDLAGTDGNSLWYNASPPPESAFPTSPVTLENALDMACVRSVMRCAVTQTSHTTYSRRITHVANALCPRCHTTPHHTTPHHTTSLNITQHHTTSHQTSITQHHTTSHHITPHHTTPHHITPHHTTPHHITPHHITSHHIKHQHHITQHHITSTSQHHIVTASHIHTHLVCIQRAKDNEIPIRHIHTHVRQHMSCHKQRNQN